MRHWIERLRSMPAGLRAYVIYSLVAGTGTFLYGGLIAPFGRSLGLGPSTIGLYYTVFSLVSVAASFAGGVLGDRLGHKKVMTLGRALWALQALFFALSRDWKLFILSAVVRGMVDLMIAPSMAMAGSLADDSNRATVFGVLAMVQSGTGVLAPVVGGAMADHFGARTVFLMSIPLTLIATYLISIFPEPQRAAHAQRGSRSHISDALLGPAGGIARLMLTFMVLNGIHNGFLNLIVPLWVQDRFGVAYTGVSALNTASSLGTMATSVLGGRLADKYGKGRMGALLGVFGSAMFFPLVFTSSVSQVYLIYFFVCLVANAAAPAFQALMVEAVPPEARGSFIGLFQALFGVSYATASAVTGRLYAVNRMIPFGIFYVNLVLSMAVIAVIGLRTTAKSAAQARAAQPAAYPRRA